MMLLVMIILPLLIIASVPAQGASFGMNYSLGYSGVPFSGGAIALTSNLTNTGQLTLRVTGISFESDFWSNGTRQITTGFPFNLTSGASKEVDTQILIPASASIGNHLVTATASWQYSNSSGWFSASPVFVSKTVLVSQTIGSLFSSLATILIVGIVVAGMIVVLVVVSLFRPGRKSKPSPPPLSLKPNP